MKENPNLNYLYRLSGGDKEFENKLLDIVKKEFPEEEAVYQENIKQSNFLDAASNVHKLKHKISILGLEEGYRFAEIYEEELRKNDPKKHNSFTEILQTMGDYIEKF
ncbi:Hpt domain-containing protein [Christiangramia sp. OXR-203]|jgi:HPt (histidine-containing phosphotransfer) domain-containing protein|uniref:Hpt domain-containing protein n=1 Tax=Christiangramia sp. OXR-203 TaxID=3100176 RepID=UPI002AC8EB6F|nr:Hpt domain-containing protein [Christiangramia sp. OXR-203]WPY97709.1 Hpt domain-containing protein [Christiangramia sp. OXR-203]